MSSAFAPSRASLPLRALRSARRPLSLLTACLTVAAASRLAAQSPGDLDSSFNAGIVQLNLYAQVLENVNGTPLVVTGGDAGGFGILFQPSGVIDADTGFPDFGVLNRIIYTAVPEQVLQTGYATPYILLGGQFGRGPTQVKNNQAAQNIVRIDPLGTLDPNFNPGRGANGFVTSIVPLADGGIVCAGEFDTFNKQNRGRLARLDHTGALLDDSVFDGNLTFDATVLSVAEQVGTGQVQLPQFVVAGQFSHVNGAVHQKLARINNDGSLDSSFNPSFDDRTTVVVAQPDGKILVGGDFQNVNGAEHKHLVRLNYDGSVDPTFNASVTGQPFGFADPPAVYVIKLLRDGRMYLGGNFTTVNGVTHNYLARVNADGTLDAAFDAGTNLVNAVQSLSIQDDGKLLVGINRSKANGKNVYPPVLVRLFAEPVTVTVEALKPTATETPGSSGQFRFTRTGSVPVNEAQNVYFQVSSAPAKAKNFSLGNKAVQDAATGVYRITIPANAGNVKLAVIPTGKPIRKADEAAVTVTIVGDPTNAANYVVGGRATVTLRNQ